MARRGFTLIEIAAVVAILGVVLLVGALKASGLSPERTLLSGSRTLRATLEEMRSAVLLRGEPADLVYDLTGGSCRLEVLPTSSTEVEILLETRLPEGVAFRKLLQRSAAEKSQGEARIRISPGGACPPHAVVLGLTEGAKAVQTLRVDPLTRTVTAFPEEKAFADLFLFLADEREPPP